MNSTSTDLLQILLIDDDEDDFIVLRDLFKDIRGSKYKVTWKASYDEGLQELLSSNYDACLLDYRLGEHTGLELLLAAQKNKVKCPIVFLTGHGDFELDIRAMQSGAADYLVKGQITAQVLERAVRYSMKHAYDVEELQKSQEQVLRQDRLASLGLLASSLAHEIGTPLGIIRGRAELASSGKMTEDRIKENMNLIVTQIDRISVLVKSLLNLARGNQSEHSTAVNLSGIIADLKNLISHELERKNILFEIEMKDGLSVRAESGPLTQVFLNLLVNSVFAIEEVQKKDAGKKHKINIDVIEGAKQVQIRFKDTGCGISDANLSKLFQPFCTTKEIGVGTGLGLATSYKLVQSWGGRIEVASRVNEGTTFTISLEKI
jgi:signal transduction histidine kinase